jgi:hypothetical protein
MLLLESKPGRFGRAFAIRVFRTDFFAALPAALVKER